MATEGEKMYLRLLTFSLGPTMDVLHLFFETKVLKGFKFYLFLNQHKHVLFHQFIPKVPCCECKSISLAAPGRCQYMNTSQFYTLYERTGQIVTGHEHKDCKGCIKEHCLCQYSASHKVSVDCIDISLMHIVIKTCCPVGSIPGDHNWLTKIKDIRNVLAHPASCSKDINELNDQWKTLEDNVLKYADVIASTYQKKVKTEIHALKEDTPLDHLQDVVKHSSESIQEVLRSKLEQMNSQYLIGLGRVELVLQSIVTKMDTFVQIKQNEDRTVTEKIDVSCQVDDSELDAETMTTNNLSQPSQSSEEFVIKSIENKCVILALEVSRQVLESEKALGVAIYKLIERVIIAGNIDFKIKRTVDMIIVFSGQLSKAVTSPDKSSQEKALNDFEFYRNRIDKGLPNLSSFEEVSRRLHILVLNNTEIGVRVFKKEMEPIAKHDSEKTQIECPNCSALYKCPNCSSKDVQIAALVKEISYLRPRMRKQESLMSCQSCTDEDKPAFYECKECDKYMCEQCQAKHNTDPSFIDHKTKYIDPLKYKVKDTFKIRGIKIRDIKMLNDELLVVADGKENKLITCRIDGRDRMETMLPMKPFRMAVMDVQTVAVSFGSEMKVGLINVISGESTSEFDLHASCFAIAYKNMQLFVSCQEKTQVISDSEYACTVHVISISTGALHYKINLCDFTPENMLVGVDCRMYFTYYGNKCICTDNTGSKIFDVDEDNMRGPWGMTFDDNDGILIVCNKSKNVHRINTDGSERTVLFSFPSYIEATRSGAYICCENISGSIIIGRGNKFVVFTRQ